MVHLQYAVMYSLTVISSLNVYIYSLSVLASFLLADVIKFLKQERLNCKAVYLHVLTSNVPAINFYEHHKFQLFKYLPQYYLISNQLADGYCYVCYINGGKGPMFARITYPFYLLFDAIRTVVMKLTKLILHIIGIIIDSVVETRISLYSEQYNVKACTTRTQHIVQEIK